jgi:hypothetical protein
LTPITSYFRLVVISKQPLLYPDLNHAHTSLHQLSQSEPNHLLFNTEICLGLQVKQPRLPVETSYRSFWDHLNPVINNDISELTAQILTAPLSISSRIGQKIIFNQ